MKVQDCLKWSQWHIDHVIIFLYGVLTIPMLHNSFRFLSIFESYAQEGSPDLLLSSSDVLLHFKRKRHLKHLNFLKHFEGLRYQFPEFDTNLTFALRLGFRSMVKMQMNGQQCPKVLIKQHNLVYLLTKVTAFIYYIHINVQHSIHLHQEESLNLLIASGNKQCKGPTELEEKWETFTADQQTWTAIYKVALIRLSLPHNSGICWFYCYDGHGDWSECFGICALLCINTNIIS